MEKNSKISLVFFIFTLFSPMLSFSLVCLVGETHIFGIAGMIRYSWIMWLFVPFILALIAIEFRLKNKKYKKSIIAGFIVLPIILIFGSYKFIFFNDFSYDMTEINDVKNTIELYIPDNLKVSTQSYDNYKETYAKIISNSEANYLIDDIEKNDLWKNKISTNIKGMLPSNVFYEIDRYDYFVFYDVTLDSYNGMPTNVQDKCILVAYNLQNKKLWILNGCFLKK